jgi:tetratricopeptide (TPR) repeat protein
MVRTSQVFVSHTSDMACYPSDRSFVQAALDAVTRAGLSPVDMRYFAAGDGQPAEYCRQRVRECEVYVVVVGFRYGTLVPGHDVSYTELEFTEATSAGRPRLVFLLDEAAATPPQEPDDDSTKVEAFRQRLRTAGLTLGRFASADGLELAVFQALSQLSVTEPTVPRQLPAAVPHFVGRSAELAQLTRFADGADEERTVVISAVGGTAGVGKTALAVHWAHQVADRFPDGQLYVNLRGFDPGGRVVDPADAVRRFLEALDVPPQRIPVDLDARSALYRSLLVGRRMLVMLDNARDVAQVRPLLPGAAGCLVLVTSRGDLAGLVAVEEAHPLGLDLLSDGEARELLERRVGADRLAADPDAVASIITACARLPLALAIVAARAASHPGFPLAALAAQLRDTYDRLDAFAADDPASDVRAVFSWSYDGLSPQAAGLFRLLGLHPGPEISAAAAASLFGAPRARVGPLLAELARAHLILEHAPRRYSFHDLLRAYAMEQVDIWDTVADRRAATGRMLDHYLHTAYSAALLLHPTRDPVSVVPADPAVTPEVLHAQEQAVAWFAAERSVLLAAVDRAAGAGFDVHAWQLYWTLADYLDRRGLWLDWIATGQPALAAARRLADPSAQGTVHRLLGRACTRLGRFAEADIEFRSASDQYRLAGDQVGLAMAALNVAILREQEKRYADALSRAREGLELFQAAGHEVGQADALNDIGWFASLLGQHEEALTSCAQALTLHQRLGNRRGEAATLDSIGYAYHHLGDYACAVSHYDRCLDLARALGDRHGEAAVLAHLGDAHRDAGDRDTARDAWQRALAIVDDLHESGGPELRTKLIDLDQSG